MINFGATDNSITYVINSNWLCPFSIRPENVSWITAAAITAANAITTCCCCWLLLLPPPLYIIYCCCCLLIVINVITVIILLLLLLLFFIRCYYMFIIKVIKQQCHRQHLWTIWFSCLPPCWSIIYVTCYNCEEYDLWRIRSYRAWLCGVTNMRPISYSLIG